MFKVNDEVKIIGGHYSGGCKWDYAIGKNGIIIAALKSIKSYNWVVQVEGSQYYFSENELELIESITLEKEIPIIRTFDTGATRDTDLNKLDFEGFLSPLVLERYAQYLNKHRIQSDGQLRDSDNWQKGIPKDTYIKSAWRHFMDFWKEHRGLNSENGIEDAMMAVLFNVMGYAHELLKERESVKPKLVNKISRYCGNCQKLIENAKPGETVPICNKCSYIERIGNNI